MFCHSGKFPSLHQGRLQNGMFVNGLLIVLLFFQCHIAWTQALEIQKTIKEELLPGFVVTDLFKEPYFISSINSGVTSKNSSTGASLSFNVLTSGNLHSQYFGVDPVLGVVSIKKRIDRELVCSFRDDCLLNFQVAARSVYGTFFLLVNIHVIITDINDNPPEFTQSQFELKIPENADVGRSFQLPTAFDRDAGASNKVKDYTILKGPSLFGLKTAQTRFNSSDIFLSLDEAITKESSQVYMVLVGAVDGGIPPLTGTLTVEVHISDVNDNFPNFEPPFYVKKIPEITGTNEVLVQVQATDADSGPNGEVVYSFSAQQPQDDLSFFRVDEKTGEIFLTRSVEARAGSDINLMVEASDRGHPPKVARTIVTIQIEDTINSIAEIIVDTLGGSNEGVAEVSEYAEVGKVVAYISVRDPDSGDNGRTSCHLSSPEFELVNLDGDGKFKAELMTTLDREQRDMYNVTITCADSGFPPLTATADFSVKVLDENDQEPVFSMKNYETTVNESNSVGAFIIQVTVTDGDMGDNADISLEIVGSNKHYFDIDETGKITAKVSLDREYSDKIVATIVATDKGNPPLSSFATITVNLLDVNDVTPEFSQAIYMFEVEEEQAPGELTGILLASDKDLGTNKDIFYRFQDSRMQNNGIFVLGEEDGVIRTNAILDREQKEFYNLIVLAVDKGEPSLTGTASVIIKIIDTNDNDPFFLYPVLDNNSIVIPHSVEPGKKILSVQAHDIDADLNAKIIYSLSSVNASAPFALDSISGALFTKDRFTQAEIGLYILTIMANDQGPKQQRATQIPLYIEVYFDNSTMFSAVATAGMPREIITVLIVVSMVLFVALVITLTVLCIKRRKAKKNLKGSVPNSASTSSTAKLQGGYYVAPGVRCSSSSYTGKQDEGTCNDNGGHEGGDGSRTTNPYVVMLSRTEAEAPAEIIEISISGYQNGLIDSLDLNRIDDDRFSTFRSQEDILSPGLRYGSLRRQNQEGSPVVKKANETFDDVSCTDSTSDSGRGGSDLDINSGAAAAKQDKARAKAATPISVKSGISNRLSPLPQQEKTLITFRGESPNSFQFDSDSETLPQKSQTSRVSSVPVISSNTGKYVPKFGSGSASAFCDPASQHSKTDPDSEDSSDHHLPQQSLNVPANYTHNAASRNSSSGGPTQFPLRLAPPNMFISHSTYPRRESEAVHNDWGLNSSNSLTRGNHLPRNRLYSGTELTHHAYGGAPNRNSNNNYNSHSLKNEHLIPDYKQSKSGSCDFPLKHHRANDVDFHSEDRLYTDNDSINHQNFVPNNILTDEYDNAESQLLECHPVSVEEDFLLPPYPEVEEEEEEEEGGLKIHAGYTDYNPEMDAERSALFSKSRFESSA